MDISLYQNVNSSNSRQLSRIYKSCNNNSTSLESVINCMYNIEKVKYNVEKVKYFNTDNINNQTGEGVFVWQGIAKYINNLLLIVGTSDPGANTGQGIIYIGDITCNGGEIVQMSVPTAQYTSVYGPRYDSTTDLFTFVGSYTLENDSYTLENDSNIYGFLYRGKLDKLSIANINNYILQMNYSSSAYTTTFTHSTDGDFAVGNSGSTSEKDTFSWLYNINNKSYTPIIYPDSKTTTTYGIVHNNNGSYTIVGGYSTSRQIGITEIYNANGVALPIQYAYIADFVYNDNSQTITFKNWTPIQYKNNYLTHIEGISSTNNPNVYTLAADVIGINNKNTGFFLTLERQFNTFKSSNWTPIDYGSSINEKGLTTSNSVVDNKIVGLFVSSTTTEAFQAIINL